MARSVLPALLGLLAGVSAGLAMPAAKARFALRDRWNRARRAGRARARLSLRAGQSVARFHLVRADAAGKEPARRLQLDDRRFCRTQRGDAVYVNRLIEPAFFGSNDISSEISRLSTRFGERARETRLPARDDVPSGVIAVWGKLQLQPLDGAALAALGTSDTVGAAAAGRSARRPEAVGRDRLPVYRLSGGAGYLWSAAHPNGRGHLRFLTVDPSAFVVEPPAAVTAKARPNPRVSAYAATTLAGTAAVPAAMVQSDAVQTVAASPVPERIGAVATNVDRAGEIQARLCRPHAAAHRNRTCRRRIRAAGAGAHRQHSLASVCDRSSRQPEPPSEYRLESLIALAGVAAVLLFFFASLIERLVREPTGLELLELERQRNSPTSWRLRRRGCTGATRRGRPARAAAHLDRRREPCDVRRRFAVDADANLGGGAARLRRARAVPPSRILPRRHI